MEEKNLIRKQAFETFFKRFPIIILMMAIYLIITISLDFLIKAVTVSITIPIIQLCISLASLYIIFQLLYGFNKSLIRLTNGEKVTDITCFLKDATSRFKAPLYCILRIICIALVYIIAIFLIGTIAMMFSRTAFPENNQLLSSIQSFTIIVAVFVSIIKVIPYEFSFLILAEDEDKKVSGKEALKRSKKLLKDRVLDYILLLLPIAGLFLVFVILITILDYYVQFSKNTTLFYGVAILLQAFFTPIVRLIEIHYYHLLNSGNESNTK